MFSKKILILYIILLSIAIGLMLLLIYRKPVKTPVRDYDEIRAEGILRIVTNYDRADYYLTDNGAEGFQYALCREISKLSGIETLMYLNMSFEKSCYGLESNQFDIIAQNVPVTSELKEKYLFLDPIVINKQVLVQRTAAANNDIPPIRNHIELANRTLHVPKNSSALLRIRNLCHEIGDTIYVVENPLYADEQLCIMVAEGDIDYAVCDRQTAILAQQQLPQLDIDTDISFTQLQSWIVRSTSPNLADSLNHWMQTLRDNGIFEEIYRKYY